MGKLFGDRLAEAVTAKRSSLVVGLDPQLEKLPRALRAEAAAAGGDERDLAARAITLFDAAIIELVAPFAAAVKPQIAFYEQWGPPGLAAFEAAVAAASRAGLLVIADVKRGDIGSTASAYAAAYLDRDRAGRVAADAVTLNPFLGTDSVQPFLDVARRHDGGLFLLVRTSNPSAAELQDLECGGGRLDERVADLVTQWGRDLIGETGYSSVGAVVGATAAHELVRLRRHLPAAWILLPGVGAQGATAADTAPAFDREGLGAVVNASRSILYAFGSPDADDWKTPVRRAAQALRDELRSVALLATK